MSISKSVYTKKLHKQTNKGHHTPSLWINAFLNIQRRESWNADKSGCSERLRMESRGIEQLNT